MNQKQLFLDLEALSEEQIEVGLQAGVWGCPARCWRKPQGVIFGKRCGVTENIGAAARNGRFKVVQSIFVRQR